MIALEFESTEVAASTPACVFCDAPPTPGFATCEPCRTRLRSLGGRQEVSAAQERLRRRYQAWKQASA